ncbi:hypothetical protein [Gordonia aichiensis]
MTREGICGATEAAADINRLVDHYRNQAAVATISSARTGNDSVESQRRR